MAPATLTLDQTMHAAMSHYRAGRRRQAAELCRQALTIQPHHPDVLNTLGVIEWELTNHAVAADLLTRAIAIKPAVADYHNNLGLVRAAQGDHAAAIAAFNQALALRPDQPEVHNNLGISFKETGQLDAAIAAYRHAVSLRPAYAEAHNNLASALQAAGHHDQAVVAWNRAISLRPNYVDPHVNLAYARRELDQVDDAIAGCRRAIAIDPNHVEAHWCLANALLLTGQFREGWQEFTWLWKRSKTPPRKFPQPQWAGEPLANRRLLLHSAEGLGDIIEFARYVPLLAARNAQVILEVPPSLVRLLSNLTGLTQIVAQGQPLPSFDLHCPLMRVPGLLDTNLDSIPADVPYIRPDVALIDHWRQRLDQADPAHNRPRVGLVWAGNPRHQHDHLRSTSLSALAALAACPATFISLQKGPRVSQAQTPPPGMRLLDLSTALTDFADSAALICNLDLVVSVDTAVGHLAGALGKPVWVLLRFSPDWRWLRNRNDSPWYPTMRLFRQPTPGDWPGAVAALAGALSKFDAKAAP